MRRIFIMAIIAVALCGCNHSHQHDAHEEHVHIHSYTAYTHNAEFFMQHEGLEVGKKACITLYATSLSDFRPMQDKKATALLRAGGETVDATVETHSNGVFHFEMTPTAAGDGMLYITIGDEVAHFDVSVNECCGGHNHDAHMHEHSEGDTHDGHEHSGHSHGHSREPHPGHGVETPGKSGDVSLTKEQGWKIGLATDVVKNCTFDGVVKVAARVEAVPSNFTSIVATASGKVQFVGNVVAGKSVKAGEPLFYLEGGDVTDNDAAVKFAEAESNYELSKADYERKRLLFIEKIVSERDYQAAEAAYKQAEARYESMKRNFGGGRVTLKSAFNGFVSSLLVANGEYVEPGTALATIQRDGDVNIVAELPMRYAGRLQNISAVNIGLPDGRVLGIEETGSRVLAVGRAANSCNMIPVTVAAGNMDGVLPGCVITMYMTSETETPSGVSVPRTAIVEEMGVFFVFVQNSPISFEKRSVGIGASDGLSVRITKGLHAGERVVTKGAVALKLSQGAEALDPHAGHVH